MPSRTSSLIRRQTAYETQFDLNAMFEFSNIINSSLDLKFILGHLLLTLMGKLVSPRGIVLLRAAEDTFSVENAKGFSGNPIGAKVTVARLPKRLIYVEKEDERKFPWLLCFKEYGIHIIVPLTVRDNVLGIVGVSPNATRKKLSEKEETYVRSLCSIASTAIEKGLVIEELRQLNRRLDGKFQELNTLFELSKEFNAVLDADRLIKLFVFSILGQIGASKHVLCLENDGVLEIVSSRLDRQVDSELMDFFEGISLPVLVDSLTKKNDRQWQSLLQETGIKVLVPLQMQGRTKGVLGLGDKIRGEVYTQPDLEFLASLGNLVMISLENARLFKEAIEKQKLEDELVIAKEIQQALLPKSLPVIHHFDIAAMNISSKQVGGDYYDVIPLDENRFVVAIGDVSGKGTPASLLMANLQATIRALVPLELPLSELTKRVNDLICENTTSGRFITFFWGIIDTRSRSISYVNAGHNPPMLFRSSGAVERLDKGGIILGVMKTILPYEQDQVAMYTGDVLVLFTDGVSEAMNLNGEELGEHCIEELGRAAFRETSQAVLSRVVEMVKRHSVNTVQSDDITLLVAKVTD